MIFRGFGISIVAERVHGVRVTFDGESLDVPAALALSIIAERRAAAGALAAAQAEGARARADAACDRDCDRAIQAEASATELQDQLAKERGAHLERMRAVLARIAPELATEGEDEEQLLARIEVACEAVVRDGELLRRGPIRPAWRQGRGSRTAGTGPLRRSQRLHPHGRARALCYFFVGAMLTILLARAARALRFLCSSVAFGGASPSNLCSA